MAVTTPVPLLESSQAQVWLRQFRAKDQDRAAALLEKFMLVSRDEFSIGLAALVRQRASAIVGRVALYAEREVRLQRGIPDRLFEEPRRKVRRAEGGGPQPIKATRAYDCSVGSEGIVAQIITELCRENPSKFLNHPGPKAIRRQNVRAFFILTDLVGSGMRARTYLSAAWKVRSVRSWWSWHLLRFEVISYGATKKGTNFVERHHARPSVATVVPCPTIENCFNRSDRKSMQALCAEYDPVVRGAGFSMGFGEIGALIAFAHGAPNNAPRIFHKASKSWTPLFSARVTTRIPVSHFGRSLSAHAIQDRLRRLNQRVLAQSPAAKATSDEFKLKLLLLAALGRRARENVALAEKTGLTIMEIGTYCSQFENAGWIGKDRRLTDAGRGELLHAKASVLRERSSRKVLVTSKIDQYYPRSLRSPAS